VTVKPFPFIEDPETRQREFPITINRIFLAHAGVAPLCGAARRAMQGYIDRGAEETQEDDWVWEHIRATRGLAAELLGCAAEEISLLGPTSLGLSLVANGLDWEAGDEIVCYADDYPANVYPWLNLRNQGVRVTLLTPERAGHINWDLVEAALTPRTRLVALASCHFLSGYRIDVSDIGKQLHARGILFCLDGIQTLGAFPTTVENVDFLSADAHKWLLGPNGSGILYVAREHHEALKPTLLGAWNVRCTNFLAHDEIEFVSGGRRYEPGTLNTVGILGMQGALEMVHGFGLHVIGERVLALRAQLANSLRELGFRIFPMEDEGDIPAQAWSGILSVYRDGLDLNPLVETLTSHNVIVSIRKDRSGRELLRFSPHFYNTPDEIDSTVFLIKRSV